MILPVGVELLMGDATFKQQLGGYAQAGKLLKETNPDYQLIQVLQRRITLVESWNRLHAARAAFATTTMVLVHWAHHNQMSVVRMSNLLDVNFD